MRLRHSDPSYPLMIISLFFQISRLTVISLHGLDSRSCSRVPAFEKNFPQRLSRDVGEGELREGKGPVLSLSKNQESKAWMGMVEAGALASVFPPCLLHTCLLCPQPRTQLSQSKTTYPHEWVSCISYHGHSGDLSICHCWLQRKL